MKKKIKYAILGIIALAIIGIIIVNAMQPLAVDTIVMQPSRTEAYFTELGHVREDRHVNVFALSGGEILSVNVAEGQFVNEGDVLAVVDASDILHEIEQIRINNLALQAQIDNLSAEESQARAGQTANRNVLRSELRAIDAQEQMSLESDSDRRRAQEENVRLQNIVIEQSRTNVQNAQTDLERAGTLFEAGIITRIELEAAEQALENHQTSLATNEQSLEIINSGAGTVNQSEHFAALRRSISAQISGIDNTLAQMSTEPMQRHFNALIESNYLAIANLERLAGNSTITSPVSGTVVTLHADSSNILNPAMPVAEIRTTEDNLIEVFVSTTNINDLSVGDVVELIFIRQSGDVLYSGTIYSIDDRAEAMVSILGVEERRVKVLIAPDNLSSSFRSGFDLDVRFITYAAEDQMAVPRTAIFEEAGQDMVYVVENGTAVATPINLGARLRTEIVVESGLSAGDVVIRNARQAGLSDGARVAG